MPVHSWFPSSLLGSSHSSQPSTASSSSSMSSNHKAPDPPPPQSSSSGMPSPAESAGVIARLKDKSIEELRKLLTDKSSYEAFFNSLEQVKDQSKLHHELWEETLQVARENMEKEPSISELRNQCRIIRTTELAAAQEKLKELEKQKDDIMRFNSPESLLQNMQDKINELDEESEVLHGKLLEKEMDLVTFLQKYKRVRNTYHRKSLLHLAAKTSVM